MNIINSVPSLRENLKEEREKGLTIGFVPTMGYLHEGHLSLIKKAKESSDIVVLSIYVNPTQFGPNEDFDAYPRDIERDVQLAVDNQVDYLFHPTSETMYPIGTGMSVSVSERVDQLCGSKRPGHFDGVATVLTKFFNIIQPDKVFFGLKDAQQVAVVEGLIRHFHFPVELVACPTMRENDGLAKSSRNVKLNHDERAEAPTLYKGLQQGFLEFKKGEHDPRQLEQVILHYFKEHLKHGVVDYVQALSYPELAINVPVKNKVILACAIQYENARLIDNIIIDIDQPFVGE